MKSRKFITGLLVAATVLSSAAPVCAEEVTNTTEITEVGSTSSSVSMTYEDEHGDYIPTDNFTVTIPKTLDVNPKEDYVYDVNVQGTIDADRSVWVCADESVTLTLTDESLASTYGITKTQTLTNTLDKIQYTSEEIAEGYIGQGTIAKSPLDYEVECEYAGSINFYINVIGDENLLENSISQDGYMTMSVDKCRELLQQALPAEIYSAIETSSDYNIESFLQDSYLNLALEDTAAILVHYYVYSYNTGYKIYNVNFCSISEYPSLKRNTTVSAGKYYSEYTFTAPSQRYFGSTLEITYSPETDSYTAESDSNYTKFGGEQTITENATSTVIAVYLSPRCTYITE